MPSNPIDNSEFINSEFYIDESMPSSLNSDSQPMFHLDDINDDDHVPDTFSPGDIEPNRHSGLNYSRPLGNADDTIFRLLQVLLLPN